MFTHHEAFNKIQMKLKDIVSQLANRINQPHVIEVYLRQVYAKGFVEGTKQSPWISVKDRVPIPVIEAIDGNEYGSIDVLGAIQTHMVTMIITSAGIGDITKNIDGKTE